MSRFYVDTCIWRDFAENRKDSLRPLGEFAWLFFRSCLERKDIILFSKLTLRELGKEYGLNEIHELFVAYFKDNLLKEVMITKEQAREARTFGRLRNVGFADTLHAILARDNQAIIITRDRHSEELSDIVLSKKPEEVSDVYN